MQSSIDATISGSRSAPPGGCKSYRNSDLGLGAFARQLEPRRAPLDFHQKPEKVTRWNGRSRREKPLPELIRPSLSPQYRQAEVSTCAVNQGSRSSAFISAGRFDDLGVSGGTTSFGVARCNAIDYIMSHDDPARPVRFLPQRHA